MKIFNHTIYAIITVLVTLLQISAIRSMTERSFITLPLILLIVYLLLRGFHFTLIHGLIAGFVLDLYSPLPFGTYAITFLIIVSLGSITLRSYLAQRSSLPLFSLAVLSSVFFYLILEMTEYITSSISGSAQHIFFSGSFFLWLFIAALINGVCVLLIYRLFSISRAYKLKPYMVR